MINLINLKTTSLFTFMGGMGISKLAITNWALLSKWKWHFLEEKTGFCEEGYCCKILMECAKLVALNERLSYL